MNNDKRILAHEVFSGVICCVSMMVLTYIMMGL